MSSFSHAEAMLSYERFCNAQEVCDATRPVGPWVDPLARELTEQAHALQDAAAAKRCEEHDRALQAHMAKQAGQLAPRPGQSLVAGVTVAVGPGASGKLRELDCTVEGLIALRHLFLALSGDVLISSRAPAWRDYCQALAETLQPLIRELMPALGSPGTGYPIEAQPQPQAAPWSPVQQQMAQVANYHERTKLERANLERAERIAFLANMNHGGQAMQRSTFQAADFGALAGSSV